MWGGVKSSLMGWRLLSGNRFHPATSLLSARVIILQSDINLLFHIAVNVCFQVGLMLNIPTVELLERSTCPSENLLIVPLAKTVLYGLRGKIQKKTLGCRYHDLTWQNSTSMINASNCLSRSNYVLIVQRLDHIRTIWGSLQSSSFIMLNSLPRFN